MDKKLENYVKKYTKTFTLIGAGLSGVVGALDGYFAGFIFYYLDNSFKKSDDKVNSSKK